VRPAAGRRLPRLRRLPRPLPPQGHAPRLTEREFVTEHFEARGKAPRCC